MKKVLVTGATGFIGTYVVNELLRRGFSVIATSVNESKAASMPWYNDVVYKPFNLRAYNPEINYMHFFENPDILIHLAWEGLPNYTSLFHFEENLPNHYLFLKNLIKGGLPSICVAGTCLEYGKRDGMLNEGDVTLPQNAYALAKDSLRKFLEQLAQTMPFQLMWVRLFYMYGKGQNSKSLLSQLEKAITNGDSTFNMSEGNQTRDFLPVEVVAKNIVSIASQQQVTGVINCCSGQPITVKKFVENYLMQTNSSIQLNLGYFPYPDYEAMHFWGNTIKLNTILKHS